jgi:hypothetical protein
MNAVMAQKIKTCSMGLLIVLGIFSILLAKPQSSPYRVLGFYTPYAQMGDAAHAAYALEANNWFRSVSTANGFIYDSSTNFGDLNATKLANYKVIMFLDNYPGDAGQRTAFQNFVTAGGGFIGCHVSAFNQDPSAWDWYFNQFLAMGSYKNNTWAPTTAVLRVEDTSFFITKGFPQIFTGPVNEWYGWNNDLRQNSNIKIICSIDSTSYPLGTGTGSGGASEIWQKNSGYHPVIWTNKNYKMMYTNIGHDDVNYSTRVGLTKTFTDTQYARLVLNALKYCAGLTTSIVGGQPVVELRPGSDDGLTVTINATVVAVSVAGADRVSAELMDACGRNVGRSTSSAGSCFVNRRGLRAGIYFLRVTGADRVISQKIMLP